MLISLAAAAVAGLGVTSCWSPVAQRKAVASSSGQSEAEADWLKWKGFLREISGWNVSHPAAEQGYKKPLEVLQ